MIVVRVEVFDVELLAVPRASNLDVERAVDLPRTETENKERATTKLSKLHRKVSV